MISSHLQRPAGLLGSMIGYECDRPQSAFLRNPSSESAGFRILAAGGREVRRGQADASVLCWGCRWARLEWAPLPAGEYRLEVDGMTPALEFSVGEDLLWTSTFDLMAIDQMNRRAHVVSSRLGWQDCGFPLREANSHAACMIGLADVLSYRGDRISPSQSERLAWHLAHGARYLAKLQDIAAERHGLKGALVHAMETHEQVCLFDDATKAVVAWLHAWRELPAHPAEERANWLARARAAYDWAASCPPPPSESFDPVPHGAPRGFTPPKEFATYQILMRAWAAFELIRAGHDDLLGDFERLLESIMERQIREPTPAGLSGHFRLFSSGDLTNKAWTHHLPKAALGYDLGATFPDYLIPFLRAAECWPDHPDADRWRETVQRFAYGYFLPAARANPFGILPLGDFGDQGLLWFAGSWHGANALYGLSAALALEFAEFFADSAFRDVAHDNLQWIAGRNCGLTAESLRTSVIYSCDVPAGVALPVSMIHGVGRRWAGGFAAFRGAICNGFSAGEAFIFDVAATRENDAPSAFTDEDWITHSGAWLSALARAARPTGASVSAEVARCAVAAVR